LGGRRFDFWGEEDWLRSSGNAALAFADPENRNSSSCNRELRAIESITARLPRSITSTSSGYCSRRSASALPLFANGRHASWFCRTTSSNSSIRSSSSSLSRLVIALETQPIREKSQELTDFLACPPGLGIYTLVLRL